MAVTTISVDLRLSSLSRLKPTHFETLKKILDFIKTDDRINIIKACFRAAGIILAIIKARSGEAFSLIRICSCYLYSSTEKMFKKNHLLKLNSLTLARFLENIGATYLSFKKIQV